MRLDTTACRAFGFALRHAGGVVVSRLMQDDLREVEGMFADCCGR